MTLEYKARAIKALAAALLDAACDMVDAATGPAAVGHRLTVQWIGQNTSRADDDFSSSDCGAACIAMLAGCSVDAVSMATDRPRGYASLSFDDLIKAAAKFGIHLQHASLAVAEICAEIERGNPVIVLINYQSLPASCRYDARYNGGHYLLVVGYNDVGILYHDPYWPDAERGAYRLMTRDEFLKAYTTTAPGNQYASHALRII